MSATFKFGKYQGKTVKEVYLINKSYLLWIETQDWFKKFDDLQADITKLKTLEQEHDEISQLRTQIKYFQNEQNLLEEQIKKLMDEQM